MLAIKEEISIQEYVYVVRKWQWMILAVCVAIALFATFRTFRQVPIYRATVRLLIDKRAANVAPFREGNYWEEWMDKEDFNSQSATIKSREVAERVLQKLGMWETETPVEATPKSQGFSVRSVFAIIPKLFGVEPPELSETAQTTVQAEQQVAGLLGMVNVNPVRDSRLVDVHVISTQPEQAALIANTLAEVYIEHDLTVRTESVKNAVQWLVDEVEKARQKVAESELALQRYKEQHAIVSVEERQNLVMKKVTQFSDALNAAKIKRVELEARFQRIQQYKKNQLETFPQVIDNDTFQALKVDLARLEQQLSEAQQLYRDKHPSITTLQSQIKTLQGRIDTEVSKIMGSITREYEMAVAQEQQLTTALEEQKREALDLNQKAIAYGILQNDVESNKWVYQALLQKMKETSITERLETSNVRIVDRAAIPTFPIAPNHRRDVSLALMIGLVVGLSLAFFFEYIDNSIRTPDDVKQYLEIQFLGFIPKMAIKALSSGDPAPQAEKVVALAPKSIVSEAYRSLRTNVSFSALPEPSQGRAPGSILLVTSAEPSEGKSCTIANLGIAMAQSGRKTLIIDCDLRRPQIHKIFNVENSKGIADFVSNFKKQGQIRLQRTDIPNLDVLPCGTIPPNPSELLESSITKKLIQALATRYDTVLIDSPPINSVTDPIILSRLANGVMLVIRAGETKRDIVQRAKDQLHDAGATILGGVINSVDMKKHKYYHYYAYHYPKYYQEEELAITLS